MKFIGIIFLLFVISFSDAFSQLRNWRVHRRGLLHQSVYNTGELGRAYNAGGTVQNSSPSMEYPPYSSMVLDRVNYPGQHNSFGSGIWIAGTRQGNREYAFCGATSNSSGDPVPVEGVYSFPADLQKIENFPVLENGELNPAFDPDEAEEIIISKWDTPVGVIVSRTSRAWSYPGYNSFIIYEYEFENVTNDTIFDLFITFANTFAPSMFGYQRNYGDWSEGNFRGQPPDGLGDHFARFDLKRWLSYNHEREGLPEEEFFNTWSMPDDRGGLNSPQAIGIMVLHYDYDHLSHKSQTEQVFYTPSDSAGMWDENGKAKQPFLLRYENGNLPETKTGTWMNSILSRKTSVWQGINDSTRFADQFEPDLWEYWKGRTRGSTNLSWWQPVSRAYGFYPYILSPGESMRFTVAEVAGYGPGVASDKIYKDLGGTVRVGVDQGHYFNPIPSWYDTLHYEYLGEKDYIGSEYLQDHPLPWYVTPGVVSIRDVADKAIEMYTGQPLAKYDTLQYKPEEAPSTGVYNTVPIPIPSPVFRVADTRAASNMIIWGPQIESFNSPRLHASFSHYEVLRAPHPLGPWTVIDSVFPGDARYFDNGQYSIIDPESNLGDNVAYSIVSVDQLGGKSGITANITLHETQAPPAETLGKVYVIPNPLIVTSGLTGSDPGGEIGDRIQFVGLTNSCSIRIYSYTGQLINTIEHNRETYGNPWYQISTNNQIIASGVYYFVVQDQATGTTSNGKFVVIH
jgi:hypothetical protein